MYLVTVGRHPKENSGEGFAVTRNLYEKTVFPEKSKYSHFRVLFPFLISSGRYLPYNLKFISGYWKRITTLLSASEEYGSDPTDRRELPH